MFKIDKYVKLFKNIPRLTGLRYMGCQKDCNRGPPPPQDDCAEPEPDVYCEEMLAFRKCAEHHPILDCEPKGDPKLWRNLFLFVCLPLIVGCMINHYLFCRDEKRPKFLEFSYLRLRSKPFNFHENPDHSLFHNPIRNALPTGYEVEVPEEDEYDPFEVMQLREYR